MYIFKDPETTEGDDSNVMEVHGTRLTLSSTCFCFILAIFTFSDHQIKPNIHVLCSDIFNTCM